MTDFITTLPKTLFNTIIGRYYQNLGILPAQAILDLRSLSIEADEVRIEADLEEEVMN